MLLKDALLKMLQRLFEVCRVCVCVWANRKKGFQPDAAEAFISMEICLCVCVLRVKLQIANESAPVFVC